MYSVDGGDSVVPLNEVPQCDAGAPVPAVFAGDDHLLLVYMVDQPSLRWDGASVEAVESSQDEVFAIVTFDRPRAHFFGPPNDEAFDGHPLYERGLEPHGVFEIENSSWLRALERMNRVHAGHGPHLFAGLRHFIFAFHDSVFECIARGYTVTTHRGSLRAAYSMILQRLGDECHL